MSAPDAIGWVLIEYRDGNFVVSVQPPDPVYETQRFVTHRLARGHAGGIRLVRGWPIVDRTLDMRPRGSEAQ